MLHRAGVILKGKPRAQFFDKRIFHGADDTCAIWFMLVWGHVTHVHYTTHNPNGRVCVKCTRWQQLTTRNNKQGCYHQLPWRSFIFAYLCSHIFHPVTCGSLCWASAVWTLTKRNPQLRAGIWTASFICRARASRLAHIALHINSLQERGFGSLFLCARVSMDLYCDESARARALLLTPTHLLAAAQIAAISFWAFIAFRWWIWWVGSLFDRKLPLHPQAASNPFARILSQTKCWQLLHPTYCWSLILAMAHL